MYIFWLICSLAIVLKMNFTLKKAANDASLACSISKSTSFQKDGWSVFLLNACHPKHKYQLAYAYFISEAKLFRLKKHRKKQRKELEFMNSLGKYFRKKTHK